MGLEEHAYLFSSLKFATYAVELGECFKRRVAVFVDLIICTPGLWLYQFIISLYENTVDLGYHDGTSLAVKSLLGAGSVTADSEGPALVLSTVSGPWPFCFKARPYACLT